MYGWRMYLEKQLQSRTDFESVKNDHAVFQGRPLIDFPRKWVENRKAWLKNGQW
jgi:hypothetical protein